MQSLQRQIYCFYNFILKGKMVSRYLLSFISTMYQTTFKSFMDIGLSTLPVGSQDKIKNAGPLAQNFSSQERQHHGKWEACLSEYRLYVREAPLICPVQTLKHGCFYYTDGKLRGRCLNPRASCHGIYLQDITVQKEHHNQTISVPKRKKNDPDIGHLDNMNLIYQSCSNFQLPDVCKNSQQAIKFSRSCLNQISFCTA